MILAFLLRVLSALDRSFSVLGLVVAAPLALTVFASGQALAAEDTDTLPLRTTRSVRFTTDEGSWIDLDLSPDGLTILFELLGDLYTLPISGGRATRITGGAAFDSLPRYSPDGQRIVFVSDRDGGDNIWIANADGAKARRITDGKTNLFRSLEWTPDGYVVTSQAKPREYVGHSPFPWRGYPAFQYQVVLYDPSSGEGRLLDLKTSGMVLGSTFGSSSRYMYASALTRSKSADSVDWTVIRFDRETGVTENIGMQGRAVQPVVSPDNTWLVYGSRYERGTGLRIRNLKTGEERWLLTGLRRDAGVLSSSRGLMPGAAFTPDSSALVVYNKGKIWRVNISTGEVLAIPFAADVDIPVGQLVRFPYRVQDDYVTVAQIRGARPSPNGRHLVFTALNKVWLMDLPNGTPHRLTTDVDVGEHQPTWSPDGRYVAYVAWREGSPTETGGSLRRVLVSFTASLGPSEQLTKDNAYYEYPVYSPDGSRIVANREILQTRIQRLADNDSRSLEVLSKASEMVWIPSRGGRPTKIISPAAGIPMFTRDASRVWLSMRSQLESVRWDGTDRQTMLKAPAASDLLVAPSGTQVLALAPRSGDTQAYVITLTGVSGLIVNLAYPDTSPVPVRKMTEIGATFPGWASDERSMYYSLGRFFFTVDVSNVTRQRVSQTEVVIKVPVDKPQGTLALRGARIVTSGQKGTIDKGDLVVTGNRIAAVGMQGLVPIPLGARTIDMSGKTIVQGYVDTHGHLNDQMGRVNNGAILHSQNWPYLAALAYGVTTNRDPSGSIDEFSYSDLVATGEMIGPRIYSTGPYVSALFNITSYEDARRIAARYGDFFSTRYLKQYASGERQVRQWLSMAAAEKQLTVDVEPYYDVKKSLTDAIDGNAELAHCMPLSPLYNDVIQLLVQTGISYTATLMAMPPSSDSEAYGASYFYAREDLLGDAKLRRFVPRIKIDEVVTLNHKKWRPDSEYAFADYAADVRRMIEAGVNVGIGSHGDFKGPGYLWELEMHAAGGIPPEDILRAATAGGARAIGLEHDIGSLAPGMLADLQILDKNPLEDIHNARSVRYVMKNGRLYESETLNEVWPRQKKLPVTWWSEIASH